MYFVNYIYVNEVSSLSQNLHYMRSTVMYDSNTHFAIKNWPRISHNSAIGRGIMWLGNQKEQFGWGKAGQLV